jgi:mRNA-degrading endonuclease RelE of RelBE toxin-antitoxin system
MTYAVDWTPQAISQLADFWLSYVHLRQAITSAQDRIDILLASDPQGNGQHQSEGLYAIEVHPLRAAFEISDEKGIVTVVGLGVLL